MEISEIDDSFFMEPIFTGLDVQDWNGREVSIIENETIQGFIQEAMGTTDTFGAPVVVHSIYKASETLIDICKKYNEARRLEGGMAAEHYELIKKINEKAIAGTLKEEDYETIETMVREVERQEIEDKYTFESNKGADDLDRGF